MVLRGGIQSSDFYYESQSGRGGETAGQKSREEKKRSGIFQSLRRSGILAKGRVLFLISCWKKGTSALNQVFTYLKDIILYEGSTQKRWEKNTNLKKKVSGAGLYIFKFRGWHSGVSRKIGGLGH